MNTTREQLRQLIDDLPENELPAAVRYLQFLKNLGDHPVLEALLNAPWDDEPETEEEKRAVQEARDALAAGDVVGDEELNSLLRE